MTSLIDNGATHFFFCDELLSISTLQTSRDNPLEVILENGEKVITERVC